MKLTSEEKKWVKQVNALLAKCPSSRLGFYATGDRYVGIYDREEHYEAVCNEGGDLARYLSHNDGLCSERLTFPEQVEAVCG